MNPLYCQQNTNDISVQHIHYSDYWVAAAALVVQANVTLVIFTTTCIF